VAAEPGQKPFSAAFEPGGPDNLEQARNMRRNLRFQMPSREIPDLTSRPCLLDEGR